VGRGHCALLLLMVRRAMVEGGQPTQTTADSQRDALVVYDRRESPRCRIGPQGGNLRAAQRSGLSLGRKECRREGAKRPRSFRVTVAWARHQQRCTSKKYAFSAGERRFAPCRFHFVLQGFFNFAVLTFPQLLRRDRIKSQRTSFPPVGSRVHRPSPVPINSAARCRHVKVGGVR
jgi:hypothetical protein